MKRIAMRVLPLSLSPLLLIGCMPEVQSVSGARMATVGALPLDGQGRTSEQANVAHKIQVEGVHNKTWYVYVISPYTGKIILRSTTVGKVTSSGRRLTPSKLIGSGLNIDIGGHALSTDEIPGEDGTFGQLVEYIYWTDIQGRERRHFMGGGQIVHLSDKELKGAEIGLD